MDSKTREASHVWLYRFVCMLIILSYTCTTFFSNISSFLSLHSGLLSSDSPPSFVINAETFADSFTLEKFNKRTLKVLFWNRFIEHPEWFGPGALDSCPWKCEFVKDHAEYSTSHAMLVHMRDIKNANQLPKKRNSSQVWILYMREPPAYMYIPHGGGYTPYNKLFNISMTYKNESEIYVPHFIFVHTNGSLPKSSVYYAFGKTHMVAWFVSNCYSEGLRERYVNLLQKHIQVDIFGTCSKKNCNAQGCDEMLKTKYKFYLAFENSMCKEYYTEKVERAYLNNAIPVVMGGAKYLQHLPPHSYINAKHFRSPANLARFLKMLDSDDEKFNSYFEWKNKYVTRKVHGLCRMCEYLHTHLEERSILKRADLLWNVHKDCIRPQLFYKYMANLTALLEVHSEWNN